MLSRGRDCAVLALQVLVVQDGVDVAVTRRAQEGRALEVSAVEGPVFPPLFPGPGVRDEVVARQPKGGTVAQLAPLGNTVGSSVGGYGHGWILSPTWLAGVSGPAILVTLARYNRLT